MTADEDADEVEVQRLLAEMAAGDEEALSRFYRKYERTVYAFAMNQLRDPHAAADVVNEVMLAAWRGAASFGGRARVTTWLLGIARNKIVDVLRKRRPEAHEEVDERIPDQDARTSVDLIARAEDAARLHECIEGLSENHRAVVHLAFFEDLHYEAIAELLECPPGTVKTRMFHARANLKRCLERAAQGL